MPGDFCARCLPRSSPPLAQWDVGDRVRIVQCGFIFADAVAALCASRGGRADCGMAMPVVSLALPDGRVGGGCLV